MILTLENILIDALVVAHAGGYETRSSDIGDRRIISIPSIGMTVEAFPDAVEKFILRSDASVLVHYAGSEFSEYDGGDVVRQVRYPIYHIVTVARDLRSNAGAYSLLDKNINAIINIEYSGNHFYAMPDKLLKTSSGVWWYSQMFGTNQRIKGNK